MPRPGTTPSTIDASEVEQFSRLASQWWDERGPMAMLHKFNPVRLAYIRDQVASHYKRNRKQIGCLSNLRILDIGCGGGILSEPLARLGAQVVGADPSEANIEVARRHAALVDLRIDYRAVTAEELADKGERFDVVLALEVVEHVADVDLFVNRCAEMVRPNGMMISATINRTMKSLLLAKIGAEYVLRWLPRGTHRWDKFVTPAELEAALQKAGLNVVDERGVIFRVLSGAWALSEDMDVNYMLSAARSA